MNIRCHAAVANGQCSHVEMEYTAVLYFIFVSISIDALRADNNGNKFLKLVMDCYLEQHVCIPTIGVIIYWI